MYIYDCGSVSHDTPYARDKPEKQHNYSVCPARAASSPLKLFETIEIQSNRTRIRVVRMYAFACASMMSIAA